LVYALSGERSTLLTSALVLFGFGVLDPVIDLVRLKKRSLLFTIDEHGVSAGGELVRWDQIVAFSDDPRAFLIESRRLWVLPKGSLSEEQRSMLQRWFEERFIPPHSPFKAQPARVVMAFVGFSLLFWFLYRAIS
jgi:hypothetical protein